mgnify:FL=1
MELLKNLWTKILVVALVALAGIFGYIRYNDMVEHNVIREQRIESLEKEINIRRKVDDILQESRESNPNRDGNIALDRLRKQYPDSN